MLKRYLPYILLLAAAFLLWFIKSHQRGSSKTVKSVIEKVEPAIPAPANNDVIADNSPIDRTPEHLIYTKHARCRMECRHIDETEVHEILKGGVVNYKKVEEDERGKSYPLEGFTHDKQHVRIVFAPKRNDLVVVTVIDLERDWPCDCK
ncbi:MAG: DUF4258 domain-containing protein [Ferruginibacter sp.]